MGADLYIEQLFQPQMVKYRPLFEAAVRRRDSLPQGSPATAEAQAEVSRYFELMYAEGYFADSYTGTCVLNRLGLSWWEDVAPLCTDGAFLRDERLRQFRELIAKAPLRLPTKEELQADRVHVDDGDNSLEAWHRYFAQGREQLLAFLDQAIALDAPVFCWL